MRTGSFKGASLLALAVVLLSISLVFIGTTSASPSPVVHCADVTSDNNRITLFGDVNGDGVYEQVSTDGKQLKVKDINEQILWSIPTTATLTDIDSDVDGDGVSDITVSTGRKTLFYDGDGALIKIVFTENYAVDYPPKTSEGAPTTPVWWYDNVSKSVCWRADLAKEKFLVDFDGDHSTAALTSWGLWHYMWGTCSDLGIVKRFPGRRLAAWAFRIGELRIDGPSAHINKADWWPTTAEWFYYYVDDTIPPTDWIVHLQRSDGVNPIPVTEPFWYSEDGGSTWSLFTPFTPTPVGGIVTPVNKFALLAPWIILAALIAIAAVSIFAYRRRLLT